MARLLFMGDKDELTTTGGKRQNTKTGVRLNKTAVTHQGRSKKTQVGKK